MGIFTRKRITRLHVSPALCLLFSLSFCDCTNATNNLKGSESLESDSIGKVEAWDGTEKEKECVGDGNDYGIDEATRRRIDGKIEAAIREGVMPGAVVLMAKDGKIVYEKAYGFREVKPAKSEMTTGTLFDIASLSKSVATAPAVMKLIEEGKIDVDAPVKKYIPDFRPWSNGTETVDITVRQLLAHTSGLDAGIGSAKALQLRKQWGGADTEKSVGYIARYAKRNFRPGSRCLYSCLNYITLQGIVEKVTGKPLCDYVKENIWVPAGMANSYYFTEDKAIPDGLEIASTTIVDGKVLNGKVHDPLARYMNGGNSGNAGVFTTAEDLARFGFILTEGGGKMLKESTIELMTRSQTNVEKREGRTLGWQQNASYVGKMGSHYCICHTGYTGTSMVIDMESKVVVILLTNRVHPEDDSNDKKKLMTLRREISDIAFDGLGD